MIIEATNSSVAEMVSELQAQAAVLKEHLARVQNKTKTSGIQSGRACVA